MMPGYFAGLAAQLLAETEARLQRQEVERQAGAQAELDQAKTARAKLMEQIKSAGTPPHTDFWHQSLHEADQRVAAAAAAIPKI